nr:MAG TPA: Putative HNHc nuclease [Caudoviricetes sp.]
MIQKGKIIDIDENGVVTIVAQSDLYLMTHREIKECYIDFIDGRKLSDKQRRMCYSLINAIADWSGSSTQDIKESFKMEFWADKIDTLAEKVFSLSNAPMSLIAEFQKFLINFIIENDVPLKYSLLNYVDDIDNYVYMCLIHKKCCICGKKADLHHVDSVGMGNDRTEVQHEGRKALSLCREHHTEIHAIGINEFLEKYHINGGIPIDKTIMKIYKLKR